jgi:hypothetical protein
VKYKAFDVSQYFLYGRMKHMQWFGAYKQKFCARGSIFPSTAIFLPVKLFNTSKAYLLELGLAL